MNNKTPMELLKLFAPEFAQNQMDEKFLIFENEKYQKVPNKYKMLVGIGVAAALGSDTCTQMWTNMAKQNGVSIEEVVEAMQVARYMKQATVNDTIANSLKLLDGEK
ncbi:MAG: carboxymuconolactone decarboxylase [Ignavibacteria bacterium CG22_combo_CG10-13_8_21_14_all_37_15]|nr:MAG: carboxymuconolactone decarboxylase [Ignavibacteria bacterium CG22_combo_CG10-13_8_21_14_all_37_15]